MKVGFGTGVTETLHPSPIVTAAITSVLTRTSMKASATCFIPKLDGVMDDALLQRAGKNDDYDKDYQTRKKMFRWVGGPKVKTDGSHGEAMPRKRHRLWLLQRVISKFPKPVSKVDDEASMARSSWKKRKLLTGTHSDEFSDEVDTSCTGAESVALKDRVMQLTGLRSISPVHSAKRQRLEL